MNFTNTDRAKRSVYSISLMYDIANWKVRDQVNYVAEDIVKQIIPIKIKIYEEIET